MFLSYPEVQEAFELAGTTMPEEFARKVADYMPSDVLNKFQDEAIDLFMERYPQYSEEMIATMVALLMVGFHTGWFVAEKAYAA